MAASVNSELPEAALGPAIRLTEREWRPEGAITGSGDSAEVMAQAATWTAYNDCVYDSGEDGYLGANVTTFGVGDGFTGGTSGELLDQATGTPTGVTATFVESGGVNWQAGTQYGGADTAAGTDASDTFGGMADMTGVIQYGDAGWYVELTFTGLDSAKQYTFATSASRNNSSYTERYTQYTLSSVDNAINASTTGVDEINNLSVWFNTGDNHDEGYVARWTGIQPGADGTFTVRAEAHPDADSNKAYTFDVFMLQEHESGTDPTITVIGTPLSAFSSAPGVPSTAQSYNVSGANLTADIIVTPPADFEVSLSSDSGFGTSLNLTPSDGTVPATPIYVRFNRATEGTSDGNITNTSDGAAAQDVAVSGEATSQPAEVVLQDGLNEYAGTRDTYIYDVDPDDPRGAETTIVQDKNTGDERRSLLLFDLSSIPAGSTIVSAELAFYVSAEGQGFDMHRMLTAWDEATVTYSSLGGRHLDADDVDAESTVDANWPGDDGYTGLITVAVPLATIQEWVDGMLANNGWLMIATHADDGQQLRSREYATESERPKLTVEYYPPSTDPTITVIGTPLGTFSSAPGVPSTAQSYSLSGANLTTDIVITPPADFEVSLSSESGFGSSLNLTPSGGSVPSTPIYVRFSRATAGSSSGNIAHESDGATTRNVAVSGEAASSESLPILVGDDWRYFKGTAEPDTGWNNIGFDDSSWLEGPSGFGYADDDDGTVLTDMENGYLSVYIRKEFVVTDPGAITSLLLSMDYDDGFVAYLNGSEIARENVTGTPPAYDTVADANHEASGGGSGASPVETYSVLPSLLVAGTNVVAVQGHNRTVDSSDFSLIPTLESQSGSGTATVSFQQGTGGYAGAVDTFIMEDSPTASYGDEDWVEWDGDDPRNSGNSNFGLIRFDGIFGSGAGQVPDGASIESATLTYVVNNSGDNADVNEIAIDWNEATTYGGFGTEAGVQVADYGNSVGSASGGDTSDQTLDVTVSLNAWSGGPAANHGWIFRPTDADGVEFRSSDYATVADRPVLEVTYYTGAPPNQGPDQPVLVRPANGATDASTSPTLEVTVTDPESDVMSVSFYGRETGITGECEEFTVIAIPDTQNAAQYHPEVFTAETEWIVEQQTAQNIEFATHLGDLVNTASSATQWVNADTSMDVLDAGGVFYSVGPGNHDMMTGSLYEDYFGVSRFSGKSWYGGHYGSDNYNNYSFFSASGMDFIVINLQYNPTTAQLDWADALLKTNSTRRGIVESHSILNTDNSWSNQGVFTALKDNPNLFLMLCGHMHTASDGSAYRAEAGDDAHTIHILLTDYQDYTDGGNGYLRLLRFAPSEDTIYASIYSPYIDAYLTSETNYEQFEMAYDMDCAGSGTYSLIGSVDDVAPGSNASIIWADLTQDMEYQWYASVDDGESTTNGAVWSFTVGGEPMDFGDAPDPTYPTLAASDGARHVIVPSLYLGSAVDADADGQPDAYAAGDDNDGTDDEDGVTFGSLVPGTVSDVTVVASAGGFLNAWMDWNADGDWADVGEQIFDDQALASGPNVLAIQVPAEAAGGYTFARFRFDSIGGLSYDGPADDGEVEDYWVNVLGNYDLTAGTDGNGSVELDPAGGTYEPGTVVTLVPTPSSGHTFAFWGGANGSEVVESEGSYSIAMDGDKSVVAIFALQGNALGSVDGVDGVDSTDALIMLSCDGGFDTSAYCPMNCGDVNKDGLVNSTDALLVLSYDGGIPIGYELGDAPCPSSITPCDGCGVAP